MEKEQAERIAWRILGEVEETMGEKGVAVHSSHSYGGVKVRAFFEDAEYKALEEAVVRILSEAGIGEPALRAEVVDRHDL